MDSSVNTVSAAAQFLSGVLQQDQTSRVKTLLEKLKEVVYEFGSRRKLLHRTGQISNSDYFREKNELSKSDIKKMDRLFDIELCGLKGGNLKKEFFNNYFYSADKAFDSHKDPSQLPKIEEHLKTINVVDEINFFQRLCSDGSIAAVKYALPYIEHIDFPTQKYGWSSLMMSMPQALMTGSFEKMQILIDHGADVQYVNPITLLAPPHFCLLMKKYHPAHCAEMYACLIINKARMISPTFLKALEPFEDAPSVDVGIRSLHEALITEFMLEKNDIDQFVRDVKEKAAIELRDALDSYQNSSQNARRANPPLFELLKDLASAGPKTAEVVNFELQDSAPFMSACRIFKRMVEHGEGKTVLKHFLNKILKVLIDCGAEFHENSKAYPLFESGSPSLHDKLIGYRQTLTEWVTLRENALKEKAFSQEFQRLAGIEFA